MLLFIRRESGAAAENENQHVVSIRPYFSAKSVLVTGVTGFLGKPLLEKLLRAFPDIARVYLLIRPKGGDSAHERLEREVLASGVFDRLREEWGRDFSERFWAKVAVVSGDISMERLGLPDDVYVALTQKVQVVINSAAVVVFDERLDTAIDLNALSPARLVEFARACRNAVLLHVSTAYVNGQNPDIAPEALLPTEGNAPDGWRGPVLPRDLEAEIRGLQALCAAVEADSRKPSNERGFAATARKEMKRGVTLAEQTEAVRKRWVKERLIQVGMGRAKARGWNDTYTFTKAMGERMVAQTRGDLPVAIVRPSIIESSLAEPDAGWIDGYRMADPIIVAYGKGRLPDFPANPEIVMDFIPVDYVVNAILAIAPAVSKEGGLQVYHVASGTRNPLTFQDLYDHTRAYFRGDPMLDKSGHPIPMADWSFPSLESFQRRQRLLYLLPLKVLGGLLDRLPNTKRVRRWRHRVSLAETSIERLVYYTVIYGPYIRHSYLFDTSRTEACFDRLADAEKAAFAFDVRGLDWEAYVKRVHIPGLKRHILKLEPEPIRPPIAEEEILTEREQASSGENGDESEPMS